ncbi:ABC transporter permease [Prochlorothrix hollandica]|uniref:ABC transporter permease n=1 Tax=Prochlorothrix hollandica PCC 9006 = CALU 1027 TaxID=317619 RepID=A0A0M2PTY2_PROHO|nr:ABC transporter permease [Prochlorothrix hollandica]KKI98133.1 ABC transporter permease [Prochlorothrix hollandica PCC 9006 = CALU 1027]
MKILVGNCFAIYKKELQGYFASPLAYGVAGLFWLVNGVWYSMSLFGLLRDVGQYDMQQSLQGGSPVAVDVPFLVLQNFLGVLGVISLVVLPMLSMGLYAEERRQGTLELIATSPVHNWAVALAKLLGVLTFFVGMILPLMLCEAVTFSAANPPLAPTLFLVSHLGLVLMAASVLSMGMFISSLTASTLLSVVFTFVLVLMLVLLEGIGSLVGGAMGEALTHLSLLKHYGDWVQGNFDSSALVLFGSYIFLGLFLTAQSIETLRFQRS